MYRPEVCENLNIDVVSLAANRNVKLMEQQIRQFKPKVAAMFDEEAAKHWKQR